jgi:hypothetical protein
MDLSKGWRYQGAATKLSNSGCYRFPGRELRFLGLSGWGEEDGVKEGR